MANKRLPMPPIPPIPANLIEHVNVLLAAASYFEALFELMKEVKTAEEAVDKDPMPLQFTTFTLQQ